LSLRGAKRRGNPAFTLASTEKNKETLMVLLKSQRDLQEDLTHNFPKSLIL
jgi:hypothetical protein